MRRRILISSAILVSFVLQATSPASRAQRVNVAAFGVEPNSALDATPAVARAIAFAKTLRYPVLDFPQGRYEFWPEQAPRRHYFISNHDPVESRAVAMPLEGLKNVTLDGHGSVFIFHGLILPISVVGGNTVTLRNFSIDYATPHVMETEAIGADGDAVDLKIPNGQAYAIENHQICEIAEGWRQCLDTSQEFDSATKAIAWNTHADLDFANVSVVELSPGIVRVSGMPIAPTPGNRLILWNRDRPNPAIWVSESTGVSVANVDVFSAQGMGFLAQKSSEVHLNRFNVRLGDGSARFISSEADAVHCSNCRGKLVVENGLFENMLDDGINVHGDYLRITKVISRDAVLLEWANPQTFGFCFAMPGERIQFIKSATLLGYGAGVVKIARRIDDRHLQLRLNDPLPDGTQVGDAVVNTDWQPTVIYRNNTIRRNRSRGTIFKTTKGVLVEGNTFDHLSGPAVLLIADAIDWFESQPASNVVISGNHFIDQVSTYGPAPITINPRVDLAGEAQRYNVSNVLIHDNDFSVFQRPLLVANSVNGLVFRGNTVRINEDYEPFRAADTPVISIDHARCVDVESNSLPWTLAGPGVELKDAKLVQVTDDRASANDRSKWVSQCQTVLLDSGSK